MERLTGLQNVDIPAFLRTAYDLRDEDLIKRISSVACLRAFEPRQRIAEVGSPIREVMVVVSGTVRVYFLDYEGVPFTDCFLNHPGYPVNTPSLTGRLECGLEAASWVTVLCVPAEWILAEQERDPALLKLRLKMMDWAVFFHWNEKVNRCRLSALQRYMRFRREYPGLDGQISSKYIAEYIGVAPESLSRLRRELREKEAERASAPKELLLRGKPWEE